MKVFLLSAYPYHPVHNRAVPWLKESAESCIFKKHQLVPSAEEADIILFLEHHPPHDPYFFEVLKHPIYKKYKQKAFLYHDNPKMIPLIRGVFATVEKSYYNQNLSIPGPYIIRHVDNDSIKYIKEKPAPKYLFSFIGATRTHPIRTKIINLNYTNCYLKDTSDKNLWELSEREKEEFTTSFFELLIQSKFSLCPRGMGANSYRLFESMQAGIAPVVISDEWVPMQGPDWESFCIRIPEKDIKKIPQILEEKAHLAQKFGIKARENWELWFAKNVCFNHIVDFCIDLQSKKPNTKLTDYLYPYLMFLTPFHMRNLLRHFKKQLYLKFK